MSDPFLAEIVMFAGNFAPRGWAECDGQLLAIAQYSAVFSLLGTAFGGDGRTTFALPDLRGRVAMHPGNGPGLSSYNLGQRGGAETVTLNTTQIPSHSHTYTPKCNTGAGDETNPAAAYPANAGAAGDLYNGAANGDMGSSTTANTGGSQAHTNIQPYLCVNFIIALQGVFPSRN